MWLRFALTLACFCACGCRPEADQPRAGSTSPAPPAAVDDAAKSSVPRVVRGALTLELVPETPAATSERLDRYLEVRQAALAGWDASGSGLYVLTRLANVTQLHRVDGPLGMRRQLTFGAEGIDGFVASRDPSRPGGVISADAGGNENTQLYWLDGKAALTLLTDGKSRNTSPVWSDDGKRLAYNSTRRNSRDFDIWSFDATRPELPHELVYEASGQWVPLDWSPRGDRLLVLHEISETKTELCVLEPGKGLVQKIDPSPEAHGEVSFTAAVFGPRGDSVYYVSDAGGEFRGLWARELASGKDRVLDPGAAWDVEAVVASKDRSLLALTINEGGWSKLRLFDTRAGRFRPDPALPRAIVSRMEFSEDDRYLALTLRGGRAPGDVHVLDLARGGLRRWTESELGGLASEALHEPELIEYPSFDQRRIPAFLLTPSGAGPHPVVIVIHGGPESQSRPLFSPLHEYLVSELGIAVLLPNVRGSTGYGRAYTLLDNAERREDSVRDIGALLDWIAEQPRFDAKHVGIYGGSYGGYMVLATAALFPTRVAAAVDMVGISNFVTFLESTKEYRRDLRRVEYGDERDPQLRALLERISPLTNAQKIVAPLFVAQGANDPRVPLTEAEQIVRKVRAEGREVWFMLAANEGHGFQKKENRDAFMAATTLFFERHLLGKH